MPQFVPVLNVSTINGANGFSLFGDATGETAGRIVSGGGDVDGDGVSDFLVGSSAADTGGTDRGLAWVVFGGTASPATQTLGQRVTAGDAYRFIGEAEFDEFGYSLANAGDVNGDGFADLLIGARRADPDVASADRGAAYLIFGGRANLEAFDRTDGKNDNNISFGQTSAGFGYRFDGYWDGDLAGTAVAGGGDFDNDGLDELIIGASHSDYYNTDGGAAWMVRGGLANLAALDAKDAEGSDGRIDLASIGYGSGMRIGTRSFDGKDQLGTSVAMAGDVNGDGFADVLVGAPEADPNSDGMNHGEGAAYLVFGGPVESLNMDVRDPNGITHVRFDGADPTDRAGRFVNSAGDMNGDGLSDIVIGAFSAPGGSGPGRAYVVFGRTAFATEVELSELDGSDGFRLDGLRRVDLTGVSVTAVGDVNGDGFGDLAVGAPGFDRRDAVATGAVYIVFGKASGFDPVVELAALDGNDGFRIEGVGMDFLGFGTHGPAGDVNDDGFDDIVVGAPSTSTNGLAAHGATYVIYGHKPQASVNRAGTDSDNRINGGIGDDTLLGLDGKDVLLGWEGSDVIAGGFGNDSVLGGSEDDVLTGASGSDTLDGGDDDDNLSGGAGVDRLNGGSGDDHMVGGSGVDIFFATAGDDTALGGSGSDRLDFYFHPAAGVTVNLASGSIALGADTLTFATIEELAGGEFNDSFTGNGRNNALFGRGGNDKLSGMAGNDGLDGSAGNDSLDGGSGNDRLTGGAGLDSFNFTQFLNAGSNVDRIMDFVAADDRIVLDKAVFSALAAGVLSAEAFNVGTAASQADDRIIYNSANGNLLYDSNGDAAGGAVLFATLSNISGTLTNADFLVA